MSRRVSLPRADELFRSTAGATNGEVEGVAAGPGGPALAAVPDGAEAAEEAAGPLDGSGADLPDAVAAAPAGLSATWGEPAEPGGTSPRAVAAPGYRGAAPVSRRPVPRSGTRSGQRGTADRRSSGRERHDEKMTVYVSAEELLDVEQARLTLRAEHGLSVDRGRIVREALAVVLADLEAKGEHSILVRRLRGD